MFSYKFHIFYVVAFLAIIVGISAQNGNDADGQETDPSGTVGECMKKAFQQCYSSMSDPDKMNQCITKFMTENPKCRGQQVSSKP